MGKVVSTSELTTNAISSGASASVLCGPICIAHHDHLSIWIKNTATCSMQLQYVVSPDDKLVYTSKIPASKLSNCDLGVIKEDTHVNNITDVNSYNFLTILASATAAISSDDITVVFSGKRF